MSPRIRPVGRSSNLRATTTFPSTVPSTIRFSAVMSPRTEAFGSMTTEPEVVTFPSTLPRSRMFSSETISPIRMMSRSTSVRWSSGPSSISAAWRRSLNRGMGAPRKGR